MTLSATAFLDLCDAVLTKVGRGKLDGSGRAVVEVRPKDRVLQILAGPGSGKTEMLTLRALFQIMVLGTDPARVVVTTFTNKAATELTLRLTERSQQILSEARNRSITVKDPLIHSVRVGTMHSLCASLLAEFSVEYGAEGTEVIDEIEATVRVATVMPFLLGYAGPNKPQKKIDRLLGMEDLTALARPPWKDDGNWPLGLMDRVEFVRKLLGLQTETWLPRCGSKGTVNGLEPSCAGITKDLISLQEIWVKYLKEQSILDFTVLQQRFVEDQSHVLPYVDHVFVDEFQDTNPIQFRLHTAWLSRLETKLTVVGDDDQSLYRFRGSDIGCFADLEPWCKANKVNYRQEKLETNWRSTPGIVKFGASFRASSGLSKLSMPKDIVAGRQPTKQDSAVRQVSGPWEDIVRLVAQEMKQKQIGVPGSTIDESAAVLLFSTSESSGTASAAMQLRAALSAEGVRSFNARSKTAASPESPVMELAALISYFFDPVTLEPVGKNGRKVEVWASHQNSSYAAAAITNKAPFFVQNDHAAIQKRFRKNGGHALPPSHRSDRADVLSYIDEMRSRFQKAVVGKKSIRMSLAGLVARILTFGCYRGCGYTVDLFRQALFTHLLEANTAPTRRTKSPLDAALLPSIVGGKLDWPKQYWSLLRIMGTMLANTKLDDEEVEAFSEGAVNLLTFHQAKGLEFDHVYVAGVGRDVSPHSAILTEVFSGRKVKFSVTQGQPDTTDKKVLELAQGDLLRELYVAMTRAKKSLTLLLDPNDQRPFMGPHQTIAALFKDAKPATVKGFPSLTTLTHTVSP